MKIFLDLDGVFANMDKRIHEICPGLPRFSNEIWGPIAKEYRFFRQLELIPDALRIITMLSHHDLEILTACPEYRTGQPGLFTTEADKREWVAHYISKKMKVNTIVGGKNKPVFLKDNPGAVLIDDYQRNIDVWEAAGGIGILHIDVSGTIQKLHNLNLT
jgi:5'(3')-deoxyribonucleotidase